MWLHPVSVKENVQTYISPKLCLTPKIKLKWFRTGECVGIGQTTVLAKFVDIIQLCSNRHWKLDNVMIFAKLHMHDVESISEDL